MLAMFQFDDFSSPLRCGVDLQFLKVTRSLRDTDYHKWPAVAMPNRRVPTAHCCCPRRSAPPKAQLAPAPAFKTQPTLPKHDWSRRGRDELLNHPTHTVGAIKIHCCTLARQQGRNVPGEGSIRSPSNRTAASRLAARGGRPGLESRSRPGPGRPFSSKNSASTPPPSSRGRGLAAVIDMHGALPEFLLPERSIAHTAPLLE